MKIKLADGSGTIDLKYLMPDRDRFGVVRIYFRRKGRQKIPLKASIGTQEFLDEYKIALSGHGPTKLGQTAKQPTNKGSIRWLIEEYFSRCADFKRLDPQTLNTPAESFSTISV